MVGFFIYMVKMSIDSYEYFFGSFVFKFCLSGDMDINCILFYYFYVIGIFG